MDMTVAGAYMQVTNKALAKNAQTSVLEYKTKLGEKTLGIIDKQIEDYKKLNKKLEAEHERLVAEGEAIEEQKARNKVWKDNKAQYEQLKTEISDRYSKSKYRGSHIRLLTLRNNVGEKIKKTVRRMNIVVIDSAIETTTMKFNPNLNITQTLLNQKNKQIIG